MKITYDAKRYYHNFRGLGNYSRDVVRLMRQFAPDWEIELLDRTGLRRSLPIKAPTGETAIYHGLSGEIPLGMRGWKTVVTMHDAIFIRYPQLYSPTYRWLFAQKVQYACDHADVIIAISEQTKQDMMAYFHAPEHKIRVVYQGCNNLFREPIDPQRVDQIKQQYALPQHYILSVGAIEERKNLHQLIRGVASAKIDMPIVAVGSETEYAHQAAQLAKQLGVTLLMYHHIRVEQLPPIYRGADVMCYPSMFEGFGIPILESMCVGTPVVTSTGSCFGETGGEAALYADPHNHQQIGAQLQRVLEDERLREEMILKGYQQADRFKDETVIKQLLQVYQTI